MNHLVSCSPSPLVFRHSCPSFNLFNLDHRLRLFGGQFFHFVRWNGNDPGEQGGALDKLEGLGLVIRKSSPRDRRVRLLSPSEKGRELVRSYEELKADRLAPVLENFEPEELDARLFRQFLDDDPDWTDADRRVRGLEETGLIEGYHARLNARALGYEVTVFAMVSLKSQAGADLEEFEALCRGWPLVRECHMLNGDIDFVLKCAAPNLLTFQTFLTDELLATPNVSNVRTSLVIRSDKDLPGVPFEMSDHLAAESL